MVGFGPGFSNPSTTSGCGGFSTDDADGERIFQDFGSVEELVRGAAECDALGGSARAAFDHGRFRVVGIGMSSILGSLGYTPRLFSQEWGSC